ncbi:STAS domain-containing protein [Streptomyces sp. NPDC058417]|uniref:STAS domain-containing protein n=1 Tax=unclassified Streptomyces TaxID=2593676 RepID=UPI00365BD706
MTLHPSFHLTTSAVSTGALTVAVSGELDFDTGDTFLAVLTSTLDAHAREHGGTLRNLHLDCAALDVIDSLGLSMLLMLRRRTFAAGVTLHLDNRPVCLARMLEVTGTAAYLTEDRNAAPSRSGERADESGSAPAN